MNKRITSLLLSVVMILLAVFAFHNEKIVEATDNMVLLEKRHPGYWDYLSPTHGMKIKVPPFKYNNLLVSDIKNQEQNGVTLTVNSDHSITLNGKNSSGGIINFVLGGITLPNGGYIVSDNVDPALGVDIYVWANDLEKLVAYGDGASLRIDNSISSYHCGIHVDPEAALDNIIVYPMIRSSSEGEYVPYLSSADCANAILFEIEKGSVNENDLKILENNISQYSDYDWISIKYPDGTGIQWKAGNKTEGTMDIWGRILGT